MPLSKVFWWFFLKNKQTNQSFLFLAFLLGPLSYFIYQLPCYCRGLKSGPLTTSPAILRNSVFLRLLDLFFCPGGFKFLRRCLWSYGLQYTLVDFSWFTAFSLFVCDKELFRKMLLRAHSRLPKAATTKEFACESAASVVCIQESSWPFQGSFKWKKYWYWKKVVQIKTAFSSYYFIMTEN